MLNAEILDYIHKVFISFDVASTTGRDGSFTSRGVWRGVFPHTGEKGFRKSTGVVENVRGLSLKLSIYPPGGD